MRGLVVLVLGSAVAAAQTAPAPVPPLLRGVLLECDPQAPGQFSVRAADHQVFRFQFDRKTYVERDHELTDMQHLKPGEQVEVVSDLVPGSALRYARTVHIFEPPPPPRPLTQGRLRATRGSADRALPSFVNLTFSGVVARLSPERLVLHVRERGDQTILLRKDTRFLENGGIVDADSLKPNMRVFVRAAKDLYDQVEAYQVVWGSILAPE
ncbi:MAG TPA: hypothetical protein VGF59_06605 [Bryobacteraceae bacterium]|jgi:hypothetical protein